LALNLTPRRRFGVALGVVLATVSTGLIGFVGTAGAHTNRSSAECVDDTTTLTVDLTAYRDEKKNTVKITDNGTVLHEGEFGKNFQKEFDAPGDVEHIFTIEVKAWDDPKAEKGWSFTDEHKVAACVEVTEPPTSTSETTPPSETTTTTTTTEAPPAPTSSEVAPPVATTPPTTTTTEVQEEALAETGASIALPLGIAGVLIVGGVGALFVVRRRSKA
jgi:LPXTG-motif cell wall-anchored protein